jgi:uncharacterized protein (UPF0276 family)
MASAASPDLPELGVGLVYCSALEPLIEREPGLVDVVEIEPQTLWAPDDGNRPGRLSEEVLKHLLALPGRKLLHTVGTPAGGTVRPASDEIELLRDCIARLGAPWWSDHLSFNRTEAFSTGFFLPPLQTTQSALALAEGIRERRAALPTPMAVETGVNYLRPRSSELADGAFVARVVEAADCGLLLDLHNVFTNQRNGRQSVEAYIDQLPLDRVWELHLAGGMWLDGYWLDAHSGPIPDELIEIARRIVPRLAKLRAIVFEIYPSFVPEVGLERIADDLHRLRELWEMRQPATAEVEPATIAAAVDTGSAADAPAAQAWECALARLVTGQACEGTASEGSASENALQAELATDPAIGLVQGLIHEFRASMITRVLPLTIRLLILTIGPAALRALLKDFEAQCLPQMYAAREARAFAAWLADADPNVLGLRDVLCFERAAAATLADGVTRIVAFDFEPLPFLRAIAEGRLPDVPSRPGRFEIEITGDGLSERVPAP